jgi:hypothetical protein
MPVVPLPTAGSSAFASAEAGERFQIEMPPATDSGILYGVAAAIECNALPEVFLWLRQTAGLIGCTFQPVFSLSNIDGGLGAPIPEWLPLTQPQIIPLGSPGIPIYFRDRIPGTAAIGFQIVTPAGADNCVFDAVIGASQ